jgi:hypothetical protein
MIFTALLEDSDLPTIPIRLLQQGLKNVTTNCRNFVTPDMNLQISFSGK